MIDQKPLLTSGKTSKITDGLEQNCEKQKKNLDHFSIYACHPCAGAMLIFSVSFQFYRMSPKGRTLQSRSSL